MVRIEDLPPEIDPSRAHVARMYDYYLGGDNHFEADRMACAALDEKVPGTRGLAINNRRWLVRMVRTLAQEFGIKQFIDVGTGLPTQNNVHQVVKTVYPDARVIYVDNDPIVKIHANHLIAKDETTAFLLDDVRNTGGILHHPDTQRLINFNEPVAALYISFFHQIPDEDDPVGLAQQMLSHLADGSFLAISHLTAEDPELRQWLTNKMLGLTEGNWGRVRSRTEVDAFFEGLEVIPPGLGDITAWRPDDTPAAEQTNEWIEYGGVGCK
jgi:hypothetical protein